MEPFTQHTGKVVPYDMPNVDTDQIIPARFLKKIDRVGFGELLFHDLRFDTNGSEKPGFILNEPRYQGGSILVSGPQFGIGSSKCVPCPAGTWLSVDGATDLSDCAACQPHATSRRGTADPFDCF